MRSALTIRIWIQISILVLSAFTHSLVEAQETDTKTGAKTTTSFDVAPPKTPRWRASTDRTHFDFWGSQAAKEDIYSFDRVTYDTQSLNLNYQITPTISATLSGSYNEIYAETYFSGSLYKDKTQGFGDTVLRVSKTALGGGGVWVFDLGTSFPTGSVTEKNKNAAEFNYPYNMQLGSGTQDLVATVMPIFPLGAHTLGAMITDTVRMGRSSEGYRKGDELNARVWYSYTVQSYFTPGIWANYRFIEGLRGQDRTFGRSQATEFYHASRSFFDITPNIRSEYALTSFLKVNGSAGAPVYQHSNNVDDIQLDLIWFAQLGLEGSF
jgi:hypothetical protein